MIPILPGSPPSTGALTLEARVEVTGEALLQIVSEAGGVDILLGPQTLGLEDLGGSIALPAQSGTLGNISIPNDIPPGGITLGPGTGQVSLPGGTATLAAGTATGSIAFPNELAIPSIPLPAIVPVPVDLTSLGPLVLEATVPLTLAGPTAATRFGILFTTGDAAVPAVGWPAALAANLQAKLQARINALVAELGLPTGLQPAITTADVQNLIAPIPGLVAAGLDDALSGLLAESGRLVFPAAGPGASCDATALPTSADAALAVATDNTYVLQVGFSRTGSSDIPAFPPVTSPVECNVVVGNSFLLSLLCCLVERLPTLALPNPATTGTVDVSGNAHTRCCNFTGATANFGLIALQ
ncbi:MAG: hypothetical protein M3N07_09230, partial [Pseudomonadota bacterium]|nr:hypothetical protein [Pseudomonadota bacterium]